MFLFIVELNSYEVTCLFGFQSKFYKDLLQFLVDVVDAELLEAVLLEDLKAVDIQNSDVDLLNLLSHRGVYRLKSRKHKLNCLSVKGRPPA